MSYRNVYAGDKQLKLKDADIIGQGGEAEVYKISPHMVAKLFKEPSHPDYLQEHDRKAATLRLQEMQKKLLAFPKNLPKNVISPRDVLRASQSPNARVVGYTMPLVSDAEALIRFSDRTFRLQEANGERVVKLFLNLRGSLKQIHENGVILGDFNDMNVLVKDESPFFIDADSFQFKNFPCRVFTETFVDPLLCSKQEKRPLLSRPYTEMADWYAYNVLLMRSLLLVGPYGGVYKPQDKKDKISEVSRPLSRITVFHPEVRYPKPAFPLESIPDELLHFFHKIFMEDKREEFPESLLQGLSWDTCTKCGLEHTRRQCPACFADLGQKRRTIKTISGDLVVETITELDSGAIVKAEISNGRLVWVEHRDEKFFREDGTEILQGSLERGLKIRVDRKGTFIGKGEKVIKIPVFKSEKAKPYHISTRQGAPLFDIAKGKLLGIREGKLFRESEWGEDLVGEVLSNQTLFWTGDELGVGFYRAGKYNVTFVFSPSKRGLVDTVKLPRIPGEIKSVGAHLSDSLAWLYFDIREGGKNLHRLFAIDKKGSVVAAIEDDTQSLLWWEGVRGAAAVGSTLFVPTDEGIVRLRASGGILHQDATFVNTEPYVSSAMRLLVGSDGIFVVGRKKVLKLRLKSN